MTLQNRKAQQPKNKQFQLNQKQLNDLKQDKTTTLIIEDTEYVIQAEGAFKGKDIAQAESQKPKLSDVIEYVKSISLRDMLPNISKSTKMSLAVSAFIIGCSQMVSVIIALVGPLNRGRTRKSEALAAKLGIASLALFVQGCAFVFDVTDSRESPYSIYYRGSNDTSKLTYLLKTLLIHGTAWALNLLIAYLEYQFTSMLYAYVDSE